MEKRDNYVTQAYLAKQTFLKLPQEAIIEKNRLEADSRYLYTSLFSLPCRIDRENGNFELNIHGDWEDGNRFGVVMTLLDLLCDSVPDRSPTGKLKSMAAFGNMVHTGLLEPKQDPSAIWIEENPEAFRRNCEALGGEPIPQGDIGYRIPVFQDLQMGVVFWASDEDFPASLNWFWDENALQYLHYETMYYAIGYLKELLCQ